MGVVLVCDQGLLGDAIATVNVVQDMAAREATANNKLNLLFRRDDVYELIADKTNINRIRSLDDLWAVGLPGNELKGCDVTKAFGLQSRYSMIQAHYEVLGMPVPKEIGSPRIAWKQLDVPAYDYIISPFSRSDHQNNKMWPMTRWQSVIDSLHASGNEVLVIGSILYDKPTFDNADWDMDNAPEGKGTLDRACSLLKNVRKAALTIDNGISHLVSGVGCPHVLLYPVCLSPVWVLNPRAIVVRGNPLDISVAQFLAAIPR